MLPITLPIDVRLLRYSSRLELSQNCVKLKATSWQALRQVSVTLAFWRATWCARTRPFSLADWATSLVAKESRLLVNLIVATGRAATMPRKFRHQRTALNMAAAFRPGTYLGKYPFATVVFAFAVLDPERGSQARFHGLHSLFTR